MGLHERARGVKGDTSVCLQHDLQGLPGALFALCGVDRLSLGVLGLWKRIWLALSPFRTGGVERPGVRPCGRERSAARAKAAQGTSNGDGEYRRQGEKTWNATRDRDTTSGGPSPRRWGFLKLQSPRASRWNSPHLSHSTAQTRAGRGRHGPFPPHALPNRQGAAQRAGLGAGTAEPRRRRLYAPEDQTLRLRIRQVRGAPGNLCAPQAPDGWAPQLPEPRLARVPKISPAGPGPRCAPRPPPPPPTVRPIVPAPGSRGGGWARLHLCPPFLYAARVVRQHLPARVPGGGRRERPVRGARQRRPCVPHAASRARRRYPVSRARQQARCAARALTKGCGGCGLTDRAGGGGRTAAQPGARAR